MKHKSYVQEATIPAFTSEHSQQALQMCCEHFNLFHVLNYAMYEEYLKVSDIVDEMNLRRFDVKRRMKMCDAEYEKYTDFYFTHQSQETWYLLQDYGREFYKMLEPKLTYLYVAVYNLITRLGFKRVPLLARSICVVYMLNVIHDTWIAFFKTYKEYSGIDFSNKFSMADMNEFKRNYEVLHMSLTSPNNHILDKLPGKALYVVNDPACQRAMTAIKNTIDNADAMDKAAYQAIQYNKTIKSQYEKDLRKIEEQKADEEKKTLTDMLKEKYKVSKL